MMDPNPKSHRKSQSEINTNKANWVWFVEGFCSRWLQQQNTHALSQSNYHN